MQHTISCPYKVFGLTPSASMDEVKRAYRREVKKYHPDLPSARSNPLSNMLFLRVQSAYEMIEKGIPGTQQKTNTNARTAQSRQAKPQTRMYETTVSFRDAYNGFTTSVEGKLHRIGAGVEDGNVFKLGNNVKLTVHVTRPDGYYRAGKDLGKLEHTITWRQANTVGGAFYVPHPAFDQGLVFTVKQKIIDGDNWIMFERGFPEYGEIKRGNYHIRFKVETRPISFLRKINPFRVISNYFSYVLRQGEMIMLLHCLVMALVIAGLAVSFLIASHG
jgi:DnaJ-class molecular chaperone